MGNKKNILIMSLNAMQKIYLPKGLGSRNSFHVSSNLANKKDENMNNPNIIVPKKKNSLVAKSQKLDLKIKYKLADYQTESNNENDRNLHNVKINLNKEVFSKKLSHDDKKMTIDDQTTTSKGIKSSVVETDLNVTIRSAKDDSAIKEQNVEKTLKEQILGNILNEAGNQVCNLNSNNQFIQDEPKKESCSGMSNANFNLKEEKSATVTGNKVD